MTTNSKSKTLANYIGLMAIYFASQIMLCMISGQWWDDWCYCTGGPESIKDAYIESGMPLQAYYIISIMWIPNWGYRIVVFFLFLLVGLLFYTIIRKTGLISDEDAFLISAVSITVPVNDARAVLNCFGYSLEITLFMIGFFLATIMYETTSKKKIFFRVLSLIFLFLSYTMESLLVFTVLIWLYLFHKIYLDNKKSSLSSRIRLYLMSYWDYLILPFAFFAIKNIFYKPHGRYVGYNSVTINSLIKGTLLSPIATLNTGADIIKSYVRQMNVFSLMMFLIVFLAYLIACGTNIIRNETVKRETIKKSLLTVLLGVVVYYSGIYAYIIVRDGSSLATTGVSGRDSMLAGFGIAILGVSLSRLLPFGHKWQNAIPIILIILGIFHFNDQFLNYQEDWYHQLELARTIEDNDGFKEDNTILCVFSTDSPIGGTRFYSINGLSYVITGKMDKFYYAGIQELAYGLTQNNFTYGGYNCDDYDSSDSVIDGVLFLNNESINNVELIKMRFLENFKPYEFQRMISLKTKYQYIRISKSESENIYKKYIDRKLTPELLRKILEAD